MIDKRKTVTAAPSVDAPEVMMPQENREEVECFWDFMKETRAVDKEEQWAMKIFLQGMKFQQTLTAASAAAAGA